MAFDPNKHIMQLKGKKYLETRYRIVWFREEHPRGGIDTEVISVDPVLVKATVMAEGGEILARAHAGAKSQPNSVWAGREIEKAETAAIGRALAHAGYGTQFADGYSPDEMETEHLADSPQERRQTPVSRGGDSGKPARPTKAEWTVWWGKTFPEIAPPKGEDKKAYILRVLGVTNLLDFDGTTADADKRLDAAIDARLNEAVAS